MTQEQAIWVEVEEELKDLWMNDPPESEDDHDEVITENDLRDGGPEISGGE